MISRISIILGMVLIISIILCGCTSTNVEKTGTVTPTVTTTATIAQPTTQSTPIPVDTPSQVSEPTQTTTQSIWDGPVSQPPADLAISISVDKDQIFYTIVVTFNGGAGQSLLKEMKVRVVTSDGKEEIKPLGTGKGDSVEFSGTSRDDRVEVAAWYMTGASYLIYDKMVGFQPRMPN